VVFPVTTIRSKGLYQAGRDSLPYQILQAGAAGNFTCCGNPGDDVVAETLLWIKERIDFIGGPT
jgi:hypothetical protein